MIVVADAGPIHYLILIDAIGVLYPLYDRVLIPQTVAEELKNDRAPEAVRGWMERPPEWCQVQSDPPNDPAIDELLDPGERAAIALALSISADRLLIDDWEGSRANASHEPSADHRPIVGGGSRPNGLEISGPRIRRVNSSDLTSRFRRYLRGLPRD